MNSSSDARWKRVLIRLKIAFNHINRVYGREKRRIFRNSFTGCESTGAPGFGAGV